MIVNVQEVGKNALVAINSGLKEPKGFKEKTRELVTKRVQRNPRVSKKQIARDMGISDISVKRIAKTELGLKPYKLRKVQLLTDKNKLVRLRRCRKLLRRDASQRWERFLFTSLQFNKFITPKAIESGVWTLQAPSAIVEHHQYSKSVMVWGGI
ncbi:DDE_3 domain-containing protein [Trichonephila clavipes]|nr:DDE_3 domain-containing protein [Trichonephila clavipes]